jgi:hypothetical protein
MIPPSCGIYSPLDAFLQEHRCCGELDGGGDEGHVWMACDCGASIAHPIQRPSRSVSSRPR